MTQPANPSATVCPKCGQPTKLMYGDEPPSEWEHHCMAEPAPAEQPRHYDLPCPATQKVGDDVFYCTRRGHDDDNHTYSSKPPVAASPAEGPRPPNPNCPVCKGEGGYGIWRCACTAPKPAAQPSAKAEEIAQEIYDNGSQAWLKGREHWINYCAAILRPYFTTDAPHCQHERLIQQQMDKRMEVLLDDNCIATIKRLTSEGGEEIFFGGVMGGIRLKWNFAAPSTPETATQEKKKE